ncbi:MAG: hypothetical protein ACRESZ_19355 [Methylococcales bacterium]
MTCNLVIDVSRVDDRYAGSSRIAPSNVELIKRSVSHAGQFAAEIPAVTAVTVRVMMLLPMERDVFDPPEPLGAGIAVRHRLLVRKGIGDGLIIGIPCSVVLPGASSSGAAELF